MQRGILGKIVAVVFSVILLGATAIFLYLLAKLNMLPTSIFNIAGIIILGLVLLACAMQFTRAHMAGTIMSVLMIIVLGLGCIYINKTYHVFTRLNSNVKESYSIISLKEFDKSDIKSCTDGIFGFNNNVHSDSQLNVLTGIADTLKNQVGLVPYTNWYELVDALYDGKVDAIVMDEAYRSLIVENYEDFEAKTKIISTKEYEKQQSVTLNDAEVLNEPFAIYLSANDDYGKLATNGRSDVNIIAIVNPLVQKILMITIPRDSYVQLRFADNSKSDYNDKLTHAGIYGVQTSMNTIEDMFDIKFNYYMKINFSGMIDLVDALNGITVESDYEFTTYDTTHHFVKGTNHLNGLDAMYFARERYAFQDGDFQRARDQIKVINAIIDKALSPVILTNYLQIMDSLEGTFDTNVPYEDIADLVKFQLKNNPKWQMESMNITGECQWGYCYSVGMKNELSIVIPDAKQMEEAKALIDMYMNMGK